VQNDFSVVDNSIINDMALTLTVLIIGSLMITLGVVGILNMFKAPKILVRVLIPLVFLGYCYFWVNFFL